MTGKLTLYTAVPSRGAIVRWMLEEVGAPYEVHVLDLMKGEQLRPDYLAINPMGKVPALRHGQTIVTEVAAICCYLADAFPAAGLAPAIGDPARGPYLKWLFFGPSCIEPAVIAKVMNWQGAKRGMIGWADLDTVVGVVREAVAKGPYILGERFTAADVVIGSQVRWGMQFKTLPELPEFKAYAERLEARPALQRQIALDTALTGKPAG
jgi:glutathione S-transferase